MTEEGPQPLDPFQEMVLLALDHGFATIAESGWPLTPFVLIQTTDGDKGVHRFATEDIDAGLEEARKDVDDHREGIAMYAITWDGYATLNGQQTDAVLVEAGQRGAEKALIYCQPYRAVEKTGPYMAAAQRGGDPVLVEERDSRLAG
jgi:hypothetical protein